MDNPLAITTPEQDKKMIGKIKKHLQASTNYKIKHRYYEKWAEYRRFWEGDQWPAVVQGTEKFPRPITNTFAEIIDTKAASLTYEKPEMYFELKKGYAKTPDLIEVIRTDGKEEPLTITPQELLVKAVEHIGRLCKIEQLLEQAVNSAALTGKSIIHTYWDNTIMSGGDYGSIGDIGNMFIDIADFHVGDPRERELQKQPCIMVTERRPLSEVKAEYDLYSEYAKYLKEETAGRYAKVYDYEKQEQDDVGYVDLIHYWEKIWDVKEKEIVLFSGETTKVKLREARIDYYVAAQNYILREEKDFYRSKKYPFCSMSWAVTNSFYSKCEADDIINNQKESNRLSAIAILGAYKTGLPNIRIKGDFVKIEDIPEGPGGHVIPDLSPPGTGWGIDYMQPPSIAPYLPVIKDALTRGTKDTQGVQEAWTGKAPSAHLNASAILALQEAAGVRIRPIQRRVHDLYSELGEQWLEYMKQYYTEQRAFKVYGKDRAEGIAIYEPEKFENYEFDVKVTMGSSSPYSKTVVAATLENLVERQLIDAEIYLKLLPREVFPKVNEILELLETRKVEQEQMIIEQQNQIIETVVTQIIEKARSAGVEITPEALAEMQKMLQDSAPEQPA